MNASLIIYRERRHAERLLATLFVGLSIFAVCPKQAMAQKPGGSDTRIIPPPPRQSGAEVDPTNPKSAYNPQTGQNMFWDCVKKTWVDSKTGKAVPGRFEGKLDKDGEIIPPPPAQSGAEVDPINPKSAFNPQTGQNMFWDRDKKAWIDSKTGKEVLGRFKGKITKEPCPEAAEQTSMTTGGIETASAPAR